MTMSIWLVRAGKVGDKEQTVLDQNICTIGWKEMQDLSQFSKREKMQEKLEEVCPDFKRAKIVNHVSQLWAFKEKIE